MYSFPLEELSGHRYLLLRAPAFDVVLALLLVESDRLRPPIGLDALREVRRVTAGNCGGGIRRLSRRASKSASMSGVGTFVRTTVETDN